MKKSNLKKIIKNVIKEQLQVIAFNKDGKGPTKPSKTPITTKPGRTPIDPDSKAYSGYIRPTNPGEYLDPEKEFEGGPQNPAQFLCCMNYYTDIYPGGSWWHGPYCDGYCYKNSGWGVNQFYSMASEGTANIETSLGTTNWPLIPDGPRRVAVNCRDAAPTLPPGWTLYRNTFNTGYQGNENIYLDLGGAQNTEYFPPNTYGCMEIAPHPCLDHYNCTGGFPYDTAVNLQPYCSDDPVLCTDEILNMALGLGGDNASPLTGCDVDITGIVDIDGSLGQGALAGVTVADVCPASCGVCDPYDMLSTQGG